MTERKSGPIFVDRDVPPFWIRQNPIDGYYYAVFESYEDLVTFDERFTHYFYECEMIDFGHSCGFLIGALH